MTNLRIIELAGHLRVWAPSEKEARWQYEEIFELGCYDDIRLPENALVLDVGANVGLFCHFLRGRYPDAEIHAFEPMPEPARAFRENMSLHRLANVSLTECALGATREEKVEFTYYPVLPGNSTRYPAEKALQKAVLSRTEPAEDVERQHAGYPVLVPVERLSSFLTRGRAVDLLKVDVEGAELDVLQGIDPDHWPLIHQVVLEVQDLDGRLAAVLDLLRSYGLVTEVRPSPLIPADILTYLVRGVR